MTAEDKVLGVIGGMGPDATIDFMARVLRHTPARRDQDHVRMLVDHNPRIPSRQLAMKGEGEDPGSTLAECAARLETAGADFIVMPCNTAHAWEADIRAAIDIPFVSIIDESVSRALQVGEGQPIGLMTTPGCMAAGLYQGALSNHELMLQEPGEQDETMMLIDRIKAGDQSEAVASALSALGEKMVSRGAGSLIAACTELPLVMKQSMFAVPLVLSTEALAEKAVALALGQEPLPGA